DEIYTAEVAKLPTLHTIWYALESNVDEMPPANVMLTHIGVAWFGDGRLALRIVPLVSFGVFAVVVTVLVTRSAGAVAGLLAALLCFLSGAFAQAAYARGYGLMLAAGATALLAWVLVSRDGKRRVWLPVLSLAIATGLWAHYFSVLLLVPLGVA